ncbi:MAG: hypothetical protein LOY04_04395 [Rhodococcus ruber]|nr:hypothetical protein [Rhodococcus ruber]
MPSTTSAPSSRPAPIVATYTSNRHPPGSATTATAIAPTRATASTRRRTDAATANAASAPAAAAATSEVNTEPGSNPSAKG